MFSRHFPALMHSSTKHVPSSARDFFQHLLVTITLYMSVFSLIALLFSYINVLFPDQLGFYYSGELDSIRFYTAMLFVSFPVYLLMNVLINKDIAKHHEKSDIAIRRWLVYLTVFLAALLIIGDVIALLYNFLNGELSVRFYLKVFVVLAVAGAVFGYYLWDIREHAAMHMKQAKQFAIGASAAVGIAILSSFFIAGPPWYQRQVRFDEARVNHLQMLQSEVEQFWMTKNHLPSSLDELQNDLTGFMPPVDPQTGAAYDYRAVSPLTFELCANFDTATPQFNDKGLSRSMVDPYSMQMQQWDHEAGQKCYRRTIDPQRYPGKPMPVR